MKSIILLSVLVLVLVSGCLVNGIIPTEKEKCGGWDLGGEVICSCNGEYEKPPCPPDTLCSGGIYYCNGTCGDCKCYEGSEESDREIECDGRERFFQ